MNHRQGERIPWGGPLTESDHARLEVSWINRELCDQALLRRVSSPEGAKLVGRKDNGSYGGIIFPNIWPSDHRIREYRLRRDHPEMEYRNGALRELNKYLSPPGRGNMLYFAPPTDPAWLSDTSLPIIITEGEKKTLALWELAGHGLGETAERPRWLPIGLPGVWNFRAIIGKITGPDGARLDEKGPIPDLDRIDWRGRRVVIVFDTNVATNESVAAARKSLARELGGRGATVMQVDLPPEPDVNGVDDLLARWGPERVLELIDQAKPANSGHKSQAELLVELASDAILFHTPERQPYALIPIGSHRETWHLRSQDFSDWLIRRYYRKTGRPPGSQAVQEALSTLEAQAKFDGVETKVFVRVAAHGEKIYIDLANENWEVVEVSLGSWRVTTDSPVRFRRTRGMQSLARPKEGGSIAELRRFINLGDDQNNWVMCLAWLVAACRPDGPFPILILQGEQGSAKSTLARILRSIIDGSVAPVRSPARDEHDLVIAANNSWVLAYDNISSMPPWLSDALCRMATGSGFSTRELYTDSDEVLFSASRPVILNGIDHMAERPDPAERAVILSLPRIRDDQRRDEKALFAEFESALPGIFGSLLSAVAIALKTLPEVEMPVKPRMADFALWAAAAAESLGFTADSFVAAYGGNRQESVESTLEGDALACVIRAWMEQRSEPWRGTCAELLELLTSKADDATRRSPNWPKNPRACSGRLRRLVTFLREVGIRVEFAGARGTGGRRLITIAGKQDHWTDPTVTTATASGESP